MKNNFKLPVYATQEQSEWEDQKICIWVFPVRGWWEVSAIDFDHIKEWMEKHFPWYKYNGDWWFSNPTMDRNLVESTVWIEGFQDDTEWDDMTIEWWKMLQSTWIKDKNGKEIFEDDIIIFDNILPRRNFPFTVESIKGMFCIQNPILNFEYCPLAFIVDSPHVEIIGNIYENPELLKQ